MKLPPRTLTALLAFDNRVNKTLRKEELRSHVGIGHRPFIPFFYRLYDAQYIANKHPNTDVFTLTFAGVQALKEHYETLYAARPCEAYRLEVEKRRVLS